MVINRLMARGVRPILVALTLFASVSLWSCSSGHRTFKEGFMRGCVGDSSGEAKVHYCNCVEAQLVARYGEAALNAAGPSQAPEIKETALAMARSCAAQWGFRSK